MHIIIWAFNAIISGVLLLSFTPIIFEFNPFFAILFGGIFFKLCIASLKIMFNIKYVDEWCNEINSNPILNNDAQNIVELPEHPLHKNFKP